MAPAFQSRSDLQHSFHRQTCRITLGTVIAIAAAILSVSQRCESRQRDDQWQYVTLSLCQKDAKLHRTKLHVPVTNSVPRHSTLKHEASACQGVTFAVSKASPGLVPANAALRALGCVLTLLTNKITAAIPVTGLTFDTSASGFHRRMSSMPDDQPFARVDKECR